MVKEVIQSPAALFAPLEREHVLQAISQIGEGAKSQFADSTKFDVLYLGKRYAPKEVVGLALQQIYARTFGPYDFKGGEGSACFNALQRCGFSIVPKNESGTVPTLSEITARILELQTLYSPTNTPAMEERGQLVRRTLKDLIYDHFEQVEPVFSKSGYGCAIEGSDGKGRKAQSPWIRIFDPECSQSATQGWYVVLHFSSLGDYFYTAINCGSTRFQQDGSLVPLPDKEIEKQITWARGRLAAKELDTSSFSDEIRLHGNELSNQFEKSTLIAKRYNAGALNEFIFWSELNQICSLLICLYDGELQGKNPAGTQPEITQIAVDIENAINPTKLRKGQGRLQSHEERRAIELQAMKLARLELENRGYLEIVNTSSTAPYDYSAKKNGIEWFVEVKGTTSNQADAFLLTANEHDLHYAHNGTTALLIVHSIELDRLNSPPIASGGIIDVMEPWNPDEWDFVPSAYIARRKKTNNQPH
ncbi:hypothetical protein FQZ97_640200 [compost metagenome]